MLLEPDRTPYDWTFRLLGFPVRVHPFFWLGSALFGGDLLQGGLEYLLLWVAAVFVSIVVHEFGHALAFRAYGVESHVVLYAFGGLAVPYTSLAGRGRRAVVSLAGPFAGVALYGLLLASDELAPWVAGTPRHVQFFYLVLLRINLWWGVFNLLPVYPLDGGQFTREVCTAASRRNGLRISLEISVAVGALICLYSLARQYHVADAVLDGLPRWLPAGSLWTAILFGVLAFQSFQLLQQRDWEQGHWEHEGRQPWRRR